MPSATDNHETQRAMCAWMLGFGAACHELQTWPDGVDADELQRHSIVARQIVDGGGFNPLQVWDCLAYATRLIAQMLQRANSRNEEAQS